MPRGSQGQTLPADVAMFAQAQLTSLCLNTISRDPKSPRKPFPMGAFSAEMAMNIHPDRDHVSVD